MGSYANRKAQEQPEWIKWSSDINVKFWAELAGLAESEKCILMADSANGRIYMPFFCRDQLREVYSDIENAADMPFPDEETIKITIPENQLRVINPETDMGIFFERPEDRGNAEAEKAETFRPDHIIKISFPDGYGSALVPAPMIPRRLMEIAFLKARNYLRSHGNREYVLHKLAPQLQGREKYLREIIDQLMIRPNDCFRGMEDFGDFPYLFWTYFCSLVKNDIKKKKEPLGEDIAAVQAVYIIEACNGFYRARAVKKRELEIAVRNLELRMEKPPYYFTIDDITKFTTEKGVLLLNLYSLKQLETHIKSRTTEGANNNLPEWLILQGKKGERWYIKKTKYLNLCAKLLIDTRVQIKRAITKRWMKLLKEFRSEPAMEKDSEFDKLLKTYTANLNSTLISLLDDEKLLWVYEELERSQEIPLSSRIFKSGKLLPMNALYVLRRKDMLADAKILLPFWYSIPVLSGIIAFFKKLGKKKKKQTENTTDTSELFEIAGNDMRALQNAAKTIAAILVPQGQTIDNYLDELAGRWSRLLDKKARENLIEDVRTLARDALRFESRTRKIKQLTEATLNELALSLISHNQTLSGLANQEALRLFIELYMAKLLINFKF
ncbi:hypothetical protein AGMMS50293_07420 [Spirochaetia bacterium]|nr:hypothetical protein AGMMS50293_07420 [Spirochaetia bacterium]